MPLIVHRSETSADWQQDREFVPYARIQVVGQKPNNEWVKKNLPIPEGEWEVVFSAQPSAKWANEDPEGDIWEVLVIPGKRDPEWEEAQWRAFIEARFHDFRQTGIWQAEETRHSPVKVILSADCLPQIVGFSNTLVQLKVCLLFSQLLGVTIVRELEPSAFTPIPDANASILTLPRDVFNIQHNLSLGGVCFLEIGRDLLIHEHPDGVHVHGKGPFAETIKAALDERRRRLQAAIEEQLDRLGDDILTNVL